jgi:hypothetical protein
MTDGNRDQDELVSRRESANVLVAINAAFPQRFPLPTAIEDKKAIINVWYSLLSDLPHGSAIVAAHRALLKAKHPPTVHEVRAEALAAVLVALDGGEAWDIVCRAISKWGRDRYQQASAEFRSAAIAKSVGAVGGWRSICNSQNTVADRSQFIRHFDAQIEKARERVVLGLAANVESAIDDRRQELGTGGRQELGTGGPNVAGLLVGGDS